MTRQMIDAVFVQARAYDGAKRTEMQASHQPYPPKDISKWIALQIESYKSFKRRVEPWEGHRPRLAYCVKVYLK